MEYSLGKRLKFILVLSNCWCYDITVVFGIKLNIRSWHPSNAKSNTEWFWWGMTLKSYNKKLVSDMIYMSNHAKAMDAHTPCFKIHQCGKGQTTMEVRPGKSPLKIPEQSENRSECNGGSHKDICVYQRKTEGFQRNCRCTKTRRRVCVH